ncbi:MAG: class I SAM-dependent methyltransferase [Eisenbergiella massiliensis]
MLSTRPLRLLEVGCGEGKDAVFFARNGYQVTAFDVTESGIEKAKRLADIHQVEINFFRADLHDYRLDEEFDVIYSSGVFHHILPELRREIMENYIAHTAPGGMHAINVFVEKPFIPAPPDSDGGENWVSGELFTYYRDWLLEECRRQFLTPQRRIGHKHCMDTVFAGSCLRTAGRRTVVSKNFEKLRKSI